jgi:uncharacterized protein involved in outer membrane biogenesis
MNKPIRWTLLALAVLSAAVLAAAGAWLLRPETHRPTFEKALGDYFKTSASIRRVAWVWSRGALGFDLRTVALRGAKEGSDAFRAERVRLVLDLAALLERRLTVGSIRLQNPQLALKRTESGLESAGIPVDASAWKAAPDGGEGFSWSVERILISGGSITYEDTVSRVPRTVVLSSLDLSTRPPAKGQPVAFEGKVGLLAAMPNMTFRGHFDPDVSDGEWSAGLSQIRLGLDQIPVRTLERALPELEGLGLRGRFAGAVSGALDRIRHDGRKLRELEGNLKLEGAKFFVRAFKSPLQDLNAHFHFDRDTIVLSSMDGRTAGGEFFGRGELKNLHKPDPDATFEFRAERIRLNELFPRPAAGRTQLTGRASFEIAGRVQGRTAAQWLPTLEGEGRAALADGVLVNTNLLRLIFDKLGTALPGAAETFARTMPPDIGQKLAMNDTALAPAEIPFRIGNGGVVYSSFRIAGDGFEVNGSGQQGFGGDIDFRTIITLDPRVSAYLLSVYPDVAAIADSYGRLSLPVRITGTVRNVRVQPDTQYLIGRVLGVKGTEYLKKLI